MLLQRQVYGDGALRSSRDVDILVPPSGFAEAHDILRRHAVSAYPRLSSSGPRTVQPDHGTAGRARVVRDFVPEAVWDGVLDLYRAELVARR